MIEDWGGDFEETRQPAFKPLDPGAYRVRILSAEMTKTKKEPIRKMIKLALEVSGTSRTVYTNVVLDWSDTEAYSGRTHRQMTNRKLTDIYLGFGITMGEKDLAKWIGHVGGAYLKVREYDGKVSNEVNYFLAPEATSRLPAWKEPEVKREAFVPPADRVSTATAPDDDW